MEAKQNLLVKDLEIFQTDKFNIDEYLDCYIMDSSQFVDNINQCQSLDVMNVSSHIKNTNTEVNILSSALDLSIPKPDLICTDISEVTYNPTHESDDIKVLSTDINVQTPTHELCKTIVETEDSLGVGTNDMCVAKSYDCVEATQTNIKTPKRLKKSKKSISLKNSVKPLTINTSKKSKHSEILSVKPIIIEYPSDEHFDEYPIKILTSIKGSFACLKISVKRNNNNTNLMVNMQHSNKPLKTKIRSILTSIIKFAIESNIHNCCIVTYFDYFNSDMHARININYPKKLMSAPLKNALMGLISNDLIDRVISACKNNI